MFTNYTDIEAEKSQECPQCKGTTPGEIDKCLQNSDDVDSAGMGVCYTRYTRTTTDGELELVKIKRDKEERSFRLGCPRSNQKLRLWTT